MPSGPIKDKVFHEFLDYISHSLQDALKQGKIDSILLYLHGAMVTDTQFDCEGLVISTLREIVGPEVPIGVLMDLHGHQTQLKAEKADALLYFHEYPHTDLGARASELFYVILKTAKQEVSLAHVVYPTNIINHMLTLVEPMRSIVDFMEQQVNPNEGIELISIAHGFPWSDVPESGVTPVVVYNKNIPHAREKAVSLAEGLGLILYALRHEVAPRTQTINELLPHILLPSDSGKITFFSSSATKTPFVLADYADNPGGGALSCSTFVLHDILSRQIPSVALSFIYDEQAVNQAFSEGIGAEIALKLGGTDQEEEKIYYGEPLRIKIKVKGLCDNLMDEFDGRPVSKGKAACLQILSYFNGNDWLPQNDCVVLINTIRDQTYSPLCFEVFQIKPEDMKIIIVKSMFHYRAAFSKITDQNKIITLNSQGRLTPDFSTIPYKYLPAKDMWPFLNTIDTMEKMLADKLKQKDPLFMSLITFLKNRNINMNWETTIENPSMPLQQNVLSEFGFQYSNRVKTEDKSPAVLAPFCNKRSPY